ncbi:hypothetical protein CR513_29284, partial [Mucuna pruriens]
MARLACCLVVISLCLSIVLEPVVAANEGHILPKDTSTKYNAPAATPFASIVPPQQNLVRKLCQDTRKPILCFKIVQGDSDIMSAMNPNTKAKVSIDIATSIASRVGGYMLNQLKRNHIKVLSIGSVEACRLNYENVVVELNLAYINFENNPSKAIMSLQTVDHQIGLCDNLLKFGGVQSDTFPIVQTNNVIKGLVDVAQRVADNQAH